MNTETRNTESALTTLNHLNRVLTEKAAFVPERLAAAVVSAASAVGVTLCGGTYDPDTNARVLYVA